MRLQVRVLLRCVECNPLICALNWLHAPTKTGVYKKNFVIPTAHGNDLLSSLPYHSKSNQRCKSIKLGTKWISQSPTNLQKLNLMLFLMQKQYLFLPWNQSKICKCQLKMISCQKYPTVLQKLLCPHYDRRPFSLDYLTVFSWRRACACAFAVLFSLTKQQDQLIFNLLWKKSSLNKKVKSRWVGCENSRYQTGEWILVDSGTNEYSLYLYHTTHKIVLVHNYIHPHVSSR